MSSAGQVVGGVVGAVVGFYVGGPTGALYGAQIGMGVGGLIDPPKGPNLQGPRLSDLGMQSSTYGASIGRDYGTIAHTGNIFWLENDQLRETATETSNDSGGKGGAPSSSTTTYSYSATFAVGFCYCTSDPMSSIKRIWIGSDLVYDDNVFDIPSNGFAIYKGSDNQDPDPRMQAALGIDNTPAFRGLAYLVFYDLQMERWQNSLAAAQVKVEWVFIPNEFLRLEDVVTLETLTSNLIEPADIEATSLADDIVRGYRVSNISSIRSALEPLQAAWPFDVFQSGYQIKFVRRGQASALTIPEFDLDARQAQNAPGTSLQISREMDIILPARLNINYLDAAREYETNQQYSERLNTDAIAIENDELAIVMTADEAIQTSETLLYMRWLDRYDAGPINLPATYLALEPADVFTLSTTRGDYELRATAITYNPDGSAAISAKFNNSAVYTSTATANEGSATGSEIQFAGDTFYELLDIPLITDIQQTNGFPIAITGELNTWPGGLVLRSADAGASWTTVATDIAAATMGYTTNALDADAGLLIDASQTLNVFLYHNEELASTTELGILNNGNIFAYGADQRWEIMNVEDCVEQIDGSWNLSNFLRGRYGTEFATGLHVTGDHVVLLNGVGQQFAPMALASLGLTREYRGITNAGAIDDDVSRDFAYRGVNLKPLSPVGIGGGRDGSGNIEINWVRRTRRGGEWRDGVEVLLAETTELYVLRIWNSGYTTVIREVAGLNSPTSVYSAADQVTDWGVNQSIIYVSVNQISEVVGEGYQARGTI